MTAWAEALAALEDDEHLRETKRAIDEGRAYLHEQFSKMKIRFVPGTANFVMVNVGDGHAIFEKLLRQGIIVRPIYEGDEEVVDLPRRSLAGLPAAPSIPC